MAEIQFSPKQGDSYNSCNARINIWCGSVRAGKSYSSLWSWVKFVQSAPEGNLVIVGRTQDTIKRNIVDELLNFPSISCEYYSGKREMYLEGRLIYCIGASDDRAEGKIRGATFAGAYVDEATLIPESFFKMLLSRLSIPGARLFATTNPDTPFHWLKKDYIDRASELDLKTFHFKMEDNPSLTPEFMSELKKEYQGLWSKRLIDGEWCLAEGAIFPFFSEKYHVIEEPPGYSKMSFVGVDIGFSNPTAFVLLSYNDETYPKLWIEDEYFHQAKEGSELTAADYAESLSRFTYGKNIKFVYVDPSATAFKADLRRVDMHGIPVIDANNDVEQGIQSVASFMAGGDLKICRKCKNLIKEIQGYCWDTRASEKGHDRPIKKEDHAIDAMRYAVYSYFGHKPTLKAPVPTEGRTLGDPKKFLQQQNPYNPNRWKFDWNDTKNLDTFKRPSSF